MFIKKFLQKIKNNKIDSKLNKDCLKYVKIEKSKTTKFKFIDVRILCKDSDLNNILKPWLKKESIHTSLGFRHKVNVNDSLIYTIEEYDNNIFYKITRQKLYENGIENFITLSYNKNLYEFDKSLASHLSPQSLYKKYDVIEYKINSYLFDDLFQINILEYKDKRPSEIEICYNTENDFGIEKIIEYLKDKYDIDLINKTHNINNIIRIND